MGTNDNRNRDGNILPGKSLTLLWEGEFGVYNQLWKNYLTWWTKRRQLNQIVKDPTKLNFSGKYTIDGVDVILKKRTVIFSMDQVLPSECEFFIA